MEKGLYWGIVYRPTHCSFSCSEEGGVDAEYLSASVKVFRLFTVCGPWPEAIELVVNRRDEDGNFLFIKKKKIVNPPV